MRRILHVAAAIAVMMIATAAQAPTARAGVDDCTYAAQQWCRGIQDENGNYYYPGGPGWLACVEDAKQYLTACLERPDPTGKWCPPERVGWDHC